MPKNDRKRKNTKNSQIIKRALVTRTEGQEYAQVTKMLGNRRVECDCFDGKKRMGRIRPTKKQNRVGRVNIGDIVLISLRDFEDDKADIFHLYDLDEISKLKKMYEIPDDIECNKEEEEEELNFVFTNAVDDDIDVKNIDISEI